MSDMNLGLEETAEVWFLPKNREAYSPRLIQAFASVDDAREYITDEAAKYAGDLEIVRVTTHRQRVA